MHWRARGQVPSQTRARANRQRRGTIHVATMKQVTAILARDYKEPVEIVDYFFNDEEATAALELYVDKGHEAVWIQRVWISDVLHWQFFRDYNPEKKQK
jgi:predicted CoA-binding protein